MIRVMIADDHPIVREGLKRIISDCADMRLSGEAVDGTEVLRKCSEVHADVLVLDISMPGIGVIELIRRLKERQPDLRILIVSIHAEDVFAVRVFRAGASGYLTKDRSPDELAEAIRRVHRGKIYVTDSLAEHLAGTLKSGEKPLTHDMLSDREYQIFLLLGEGKRIADIAAGMALSPKTVSTYRTRIFQKMRFENNAELIRYVIENHLIP
jgi:two-component system, NarL family, invasion response regulator UvrY